MTAAREPLDEPGDESRPEADETTVSDEEWPVTELYRIEPGATENGVDETDDDERAALVAPAAPVQDAAPVLEAAVDRKPGRRFPPDVGPGVLVALIAALILIPGAIWLLLNTTEEAASTPSATDTRITTGTNDEPAPTTPAPSKTVPDLVGLSLDDARSLLENAGLRARVRRVDSERPAGEVLQQSPAADTKAPNGIVVLTVSGGVGQATVPDVVGLDVEDATQALRDAGLQPELQEVRSTQPESTVISQTPRAGEEVDRQAVVRLEVATPPKKVAPVRVDVPSLVGLTSSAARSRLRQIGLRSTVTTVESFDAKGVVVGQSPGAGAELRKGSEVTLRVSSGPPTVAVPDVIGLDEQSARQRLESAGFQVQIVDGSTSDPNEDGLVTEQSPAGDTRRAEGTLVTLTVARFS